MRQSAQSDLWRPEETGAFRVQDHLVSGETHFAESRELRLWGYLAPAVAEVRVGGRRHPRRVYHPTDLRLTTPDIAITRIPDDEVTIRSLTLSNRVLEEALGAPVASLAEDFWRLQKYTFRSPIIGGVTAQLSRMGDAGSANGSIVDQAYVDAMLHAVAHELSRVAGSGSVRSLAPGRLTAAELRRLNGFIDASLAQKLQLRDLAAALAMPLAAFQDAIKRTTGATAYQHLVQRRILAARRLLENSDASLAEIAFLTGFTSQSRMTDVFKSKLGVTPGQMRKRVRAAR